MQTIIKKNLSFFIGFLLFLIAGLVLLLTTEKGSIILYFNEHRSLEGDLFFLYATRLGEAFPYLLAIVYFLFVRFRYSLMVLIAGLSAGIISLITKTFFDHNRPSLYFKELGVFEQLNLIDGIQLWEKYSFPSGHTMSAFAVYGTLAFLFGRKKSLGIVFLLLAILVGVSRMYLVQHFLQDIYLGAILGVLIAMIIYAFQSKFPYNQNHWLDRSLLFKR